MSRNSTPFRRVALATAAILSPLLSFSASAQSDEQDMRSYAQSSYGFCDVRKIAAVWRLDFWEAKLTIGSKVSGGMSSDLDYEIARTADVVACDWSDADYSSQDAEALARAWNRPIGEAKAKASSMLTTFGNKKFHEEVADILGWG